MLLLSKTGNIVLTFNKTFQKIIFYNYMMANIGGTVNIFVFRYNRLNETWTLLYSSIYENQLSIKNVSVKKQHFIEINLYDIESFF